ncbi:MAG: hypothetical protein AABZ55_09000, partial [Bdellovibrionota bacterium]
MERRSEELAEPYIEQLRKRLEIKSGEVKPLEGYIEKLKNSDPSLKEAPAGEGSGDSYSEKIRTQLESKEQGGAIAAVNEGRSKLEAKRVGEIHHAVAIRFAPSLSRQNTADSEYLKRNFSDVYGGNWTPQLDFQFELQPFHSEWLGNIGIVISSGFAVSHGFGKFPLILPDAADVAADFSSDSRTKFQFFSVPLALGANYRFNLFRVVRPYIGFYPTLIGFAELRSDTPRGVKGYSKGFLVSGGASILLDWLSPDSTWNYYTEFGVKHYYLTIDYSRLTTVSSSVNFSVSGISAGLTFEY